MNADLEMALRYRNYAEELRLIAADRSTTENRETLLKVAADYERIADSLAAMSHAKEATSRRPNNFN